MVVPQKRQRIPEDYLFGLPIPGTPRLEQHVHS